MHGFTVRLILWAAVFEGDGDPSGFISGDEFRDQHHIAFPNELVHYFLILLRQLSGT